jgi:hypothetical protein
VSALDRCPTCSSNGVDGWHKSRCAYQAGLRQQVVDHAARYDISSVRALDLWAHLRDIGDDGTQAMLRVVKVLDLGWRPVVSS